MRVRAFLLCAALSGCGVLSGLDGLEVAGDASTPDATKDASDASDVLDASDADAATQLSDAAGIHCGSALICQIGQSCCISSSGSQYAYACAAGDCANTATLASLRCDDPSDCPSGQICCFSNNLAQCTSGSTTCANQLCVNAQQCGNTANTCAPFSAGFGLSLSRCQ